MYFLTLDIGTSELKVSVFDLSGKLHSTYRSQVPLTNQAGFLELDPAVLWQSVSSGVLAIPSDLRRQLAAAAVTSHGESFIGLDQAGRPAGNVILNIDSRATEQMADFVAHFGRQELYRKTGLPPHPMYTLPKIAWLRQHRPEVFERTDRFLCMEDYIHSCLQIEPALSYSLASRTLGFNIRSGTWDAELLRLAGISSCQLSRPEKSGRVVGTASPKIASELGLPANLQWCTAGHDQACAAAGSGVSHPGTAADGTGTFECVSIPLTDPLLSPLSLEANLACECHLLPDKFLSLAYIPGGIVLKWLREQLLPDADYDVLLDGLPLEPTGIFCFPYFLGTGTPWLDSHSRATIYGLSADTSRAALVQALLEGISYEMKLNLELLRRAGIEIREILATGGGARSPAWLQLKSDIFGCPVVHIPGEASSRGAAISAAIAVGGYRSWEEAISAMVERGRRFEPRPRAHQQYQQLHRQYQELAERLYGYKSSSACNQVHPKEHS